MTKEDDAVRYTGKGQASRLSIQHEIAGGPLGIFGEEAKKHDWNIGEVSSFFMRGFVKPSRVFNSGLEIQYRSKR